MNEVEFRNWLLKNGTNKKVQGDCVARLKRVERELGHCDLDEEYRRDRCQFLLDAFLNMGNNESMKKYPHAKFPIGKYYMSTYRHSIKKYVEFCDEAIAVKQK